MKNLCVVMCCIMLVGCGMPNTSGTTRNTPDIVKKAEKVEERQIVKIGVIAPLSGPGSSYGQDVVEVVNRFGNQFNETQTNLELTRVVENGGCNGKDAVSAARKLIEVDNVVAIIGGVCSSETLAAGPIAQEAGIMMLAPGSAASQISDIGEYVVRTYNNTRAGETLVAALDSTYTHALVVTEQKDYPQDMADRFVDAFPGEVTYISYQSADNDMKVLAKQVAEIEDTDALFMFSQSEATSIPLALALEDEGVLERYKNRIYGANNLLVAPFMERLGELTEGMQEVNVASVEINEQQDVYLETLANYDIQGDGFTILQAADAFMMITEALVSLSTYDNVDEVRATIKEFVYSFTGITPYEGYLGNYWFDSVGDAVGIDFEMYQIIDGKRIAQKDLDIENDVANSVPVVENVDEEMVQEPMVNKDTHPLLLEDWTTVDFMTDAGVLMLPKYMETVLVPMEKEFYADVTFIKQWFIHNNRSPSNNLSVRVLSYEGDEILEPRYMNIVSCMQGNDKLCNNIATTPSFSTSFGNIQDILPIEKDGEVIGLGYIGSTYQDIPGSIDVQLVFPTDEYLVYVTQTVYAYEDSSRGIAYEEEYERVGYDKFDYSTYFDEFVTQSMYEKDITAVLMNMIATISLEK